MKKLFLAVLTGQSGSGKSFAIEKFFMPNGFSPVPTLTTAPRENPRPNDELFYTVIDGKEWAQRHKAGDLLWTVSIRDGADTRSYSTSKAVLLETLRKSDGKAVMAITPDQLWPLYRFLRENNVYMLHIHLIVSQEIREQRMIQREDTPQTIQRRIQDEEGWGEIVCDFSLAIRTNACSKFLSSENKSSNFFRALEGILKEFGFPCKAA